MSLLHYLSINVFIYHTWYDFRYLQSLVCVWLLTCVRICDGEKITYVKTWSTFSPVSSRAETLSSVSINLLFRLITKKCEYQERHLQMNSDSSSAVTGWTRQCHWAVNHTECWAEVWSQATFLYHRNYKSAPEEEVKHDESPTWTKLKCHTELTRTPYNTHLRTVVHVVVLMLLMLLLLMLLLLLLLMYSSWVVWWRWWILSQSLLW